MSGGTYDYAYSKISEFIEDMRPGSGEGTASPIQREAFRQHLKIVQEAMRAIEWNDSGDGDDREASLINQVVTTPAMVHVAVKNLRDVLNLLEDVVTRLEDVVTRLEAKPQ